MKTLIIDLRKENLKESILGLINQYDITIDHEGLQEAMNITIDNIGKYMETILSCKYGRLRLSLVDDYGNEQGTDYLDIGEIHLVEEMPDNTYCHMYHVASGLDNVLQELKAEYKNIKAQKKTLKTTIKNLEGDGVNE